LFDEIEGFEKNRKRIERKRSLIGFLYVSIIVTMAVFGFVNFLVVLILALITVNLMNKVK